MNDQETNGKSEAPLAAAAGSDEAINYPVTVDAKKLWALIGTGDAIIRNPKPDRIAHWNELRKIMAAQCRKNPNEKAKAGLE